MGTGYTKPFSLLLIALIIVFYSCTNVDNNAKQGSKNLESNYTLDIKIKGAPNKAVYLSRYFGNKTVTIDTLVTDNKGRIKKILNPGIETGLYELALGNKSSFNFIINHEDIELQTFVVNSTDSMQVIHSKENRILYDYYRKRKIVNKKLGLLAPLIQNYPQKDKFYEISVKERNRIQQEHALYLQKQVTELPGSFVSRYIQFTGFYKTDPLLTEEEQKQILMHDYFTNADFCDSTMLNSDAIPQKIISYLSLFSDKSKTQAELEESYKKAVDEILDRALCNEQVFEYVLNYLVGGFEQLKYEEVIAYLGEKYIPLISCVNENLKKTLENKTDKYEKVSIGKKAPDFSLKTVENEILKLDEINSEKILIIFWASWCPHCKNILPSIENVASSYSKQKLETIAISLDTSKDEWVDFLNKHSFSWINVSELKGWDSKIAVDYNIYATPTIILLDKDRNIIAKPRTVHELKELL